MAQPGGGRPKQPAKKRKASEHEPERAQGVTTVARLVKDARPNGPHKKRRRNDTEKLFLVEMEDGVKRAVVTDNIASYVTRNRFKLANTAGVRVRTRTTRCGLGECKGKRMVFTRPATPAPTGGAPGKTATTTTPAAALEPTTVVVDEPCELTRVALGFSSSQR